MFRLSLAIGQAPESQVAAEALRLGGDSVISPGTGISYAGNGLVIPARVVVRKDVGGHLNRADPPW